MTKENKETAAAKALAALANVMSHDKDEFARLVTCEHRTIQQQMFGLMLTTIRKWASVEHFDARNEHTVMTCREIVEVVGDYDAPFI